MRKSEHFQICDSCGKQFRYGEIKHFEIYFETWGRMFGMFGEKGKVYDFCKECLPKVKLEKLK